MDYARKNRTRGWRTFNFGERSKVIGAAADNLPGATVAEDRLGRPRPLDYEHFEQVNYKFNDELEEFN